MSLASTSSINSSQPRNHEQCDQSQTLREENEDRKRGIKSGNEEEKGRVGDGEEEKRKEKKTRMMKGFFSLSLQVVVEGKERREVRRRKRKR